MAAHPIVHVELPAANTEAAAKFYGDAFGWKFERDPSFDYWMFQAAPGPGGGLVSVGPGESGAPPTKPGDVLVYIGSDDIEADLAKIESLGGKTVSPSMEIPGTGWFAIFTDPTGNRMALYKAM